MAVIIGQIPWQLNYKPEEDRVASISLGCNAPCGGTIICKNGLGVAWIVAPNTSEVSRTWYCRDDAVTTATNCTSATSWFLPTCVQLKSPGYSCRTFWDSFCSTAYWSSSEYDSGFAWAVFFSDGIARVNTKSNTRCVRAFRCVTY